MNRRLIFTLVFTLVFLVSVGSVATFVPSAAKNEPPTAAEVTKSEYTGYIIKDFTARWLFQKRRGQSHTNNRHAHLFPARA